MIDAVHRTGPADWPGSQIERYRGPGGVPLNSIRSAAI